MPANAQRQLSWAAHYDQVATHHSSLSEQGWQLVHVSEDKGIYLGVYARDESLVARQRYLLRQRT